MSMLVNPFAFGSGGTGPGGAYQHARAITIDNAQVPNTDQTDFPFLFTGTFAYLATVANGGDVEHASGFDIIFTSDAAGLNQLDHEIETYNATTGVVNFWVKIPTLATAADTIIYIHYGNSSITTSQEDKAGVWGSSFALVTHLEDGITVTGADSTGNNHTPLIGSNVPAVTGQIDGGSSHFSGDVDNTLRYAEISDSLSPTTAVTLSLWFKRQGVSTNQIVVNKGDGATNPGSSYEFAFNTSNQLRFEINDGSAWKTATYSTAISDTTIWHLAHGTFDGSDVKIYTEGVLRTTTAFSGSINNSTSSLFYGLASNGTLRYVGHLDEVRVATGVARSADWIATEFNNQSSPGTFFSVGGEL